MFTEKQINEAGLTSKVSRLKAKGTGGNNQKKGSRYEDYYALYEIVKFASGKKKSAQIKDQVSNCFVDDLVLKNLGSESYYQLKNVKKLGWTSSKLIEDFEDQYKLCNSIKGRKFELLLVLSSKKSFERMSEMPSSACQNTSVIHFPEPNNIEDLVTSYDDFNSWLKKLSAKKHPTIMDLDYLGKTILAEWIGLSISEKFIKIDKIIKNASRRMSTPIKKKWTPSKEWSEVNKILKKIPSLKYSIANGVFEYWIGEYDTGIKDDDLNSRAFKNFLKRILEKKPKTVTEFESQL